MRGAVLILALAGCGGTPATPPVAVEPTIALVAPAAGSDDVVVASVDGRPVWSSCITAQAAAAKGEVAQRRDRALHECVDFELLAQAAEKRGLARDASVVEAHHTELVSRLIARDFEAIYQTPADLKGAFFDTMVAQNAQREHDPEFRASAYVRVEIPDSASAELDAQAHALADRIAAAVAGETGLFAVNLFAIGDAIAKGSPLKVVHANVPFTVIERLTPAYGGALYALPAIGRASAAVRDRIAGYPDKGGWDVIVWTDVLPAHEMTHDELVTAMFPDVRRAYFKQWVAQITAALHVHVELDTKQLADGDEKPAAKKPATEGGS